MIDQKDVTIVIPHLGKTKEQRYALEQCIQSLLATVPDMKKIVAVNGDSDLIIHHQHPSISYIYVQEQGQCKAVNAAVATTNTPWIFITNDDMIYPPGWWENLMQGHYYDIGCVSPRLVEPRPGAPTFEVFFAGGAGGDFDKEKFLGYAEEHAEHSYSLQTGFNLPFLIRRDIWDTICGYDIQYDPFGSNGDSDLQAKIHLAGIQPHQNPNAVVYHFSQTSGTSHPSNRSYWETNWHYFIEKWGFERQSAPDVWHSVNIIDNDKLKYHPDWEGKYK